MESIIKYLNRTVSIESSFNSLHDYLLTNDIETIIPTLNKNVKTKPSIKIFFENTNEVSLDYLIKEKKINIKGLWDKNFNPQSIIFSWIPWLEQLIQKEKMYTIHSSSVSKKGKGLLFIGCSGSGKSTLALELCKEYGFNFISNDRTAIREHEIIGGTKILNFKLGALKKYFPKYITAKEELFKNPWHSYKRLDSRDLGINLENNFVELEKIYLIRIDESVREVNSFDCLDGKYKVLLYQELSNWIRGSNILLFNMSKPCPNFDTDFLSAQRVELINKIVDGKKIKTLHGPLKGISKYLNELYS